MVKKKNIGWRPCGDHRHLNTDTLDTLFPTLLISPPGFQVRQSSPSLISLRVNIRSMKLQRTCKKQQSSPPSKCTSFYAFLLVCSGRPALLLILRWWHSYIQQRSILIHWQPSWSFSPLPEAWFDHGVAQVWFPCVQDWVPWTPPLRHQMFSSC